MKGIVMALVVMVAADSSSSPRATQSSPSATLAPSPAGLKGDLPVVALNYDAQGNSRAVGGFVHFPGGAFVRDPRADMVADDTRPSAGLTRRLRTTVQPYLFGTSNGMYGEITYDRPAERWLPVVRAQVSPDGLRYAYTELLQLPGDVLGGATSGGRIHIADVRSGSDQVVYSYRGRQPISVVSFEQDGVYISPGCEGVEVAVPGACAPDSFTLLRLNATTGEVTKVSDRRGSWVIARGFAWMTTLEGGADQPNQLLRIDLTTGSEKTWDREPITLHQAGSCCWTMTVVGTDGDGAPLVMLPLARQALPTLGTNESLLLRITGPAQAERIVSGQGCCLDAIADLNGTWFAVEFGPAQGIYLYANTSGVRKVSDIAGLPVGTLN
jgi:hypothetical protein